jgi:hypothetical protein
MLCQQQLQSHTRICSSGRISVSRCHVVVRAQAATDAVKVFYRSNWGSAKLHGSLQGAAWKDFELKKVTLPTFHPAFSSTNTWQDAAAAHTVSGLSLVGLSMSALQVTSAPGKWLSTSIPINGSNKASPLLEFVVTDGGSQWDKPAEGRSCQLAEVLGMPQKPHQHLMPVSPVHTCYDLMSARQCICASPLPSRHLQLATSLPQVQPQHTPQLHADFRTAAGCLQVAYAPPLPQPHVHTPYATLAC